MSSRRDAGTGGRRPLRVATRGSALALHQTAIVGRLLGAGDAPVAIEPVVVSTEGDRRTDVPLSEIGGKGVFAKEVQLALLEGRADIAVHSAKDLPALTPEGLLIGAYPDRGDPRDALVGSRLSAIRPGGVVGTGSQRRRAQLAHLRPDLVFAELRGNMATRLERAKEFDAIVVAAAALARLDLAAHLAEVLDDEIVVPQVGQGALAVECRADDGDTRSILQRIDRPEIRRTVEAERAFLVELGGDCSLPAGAHARLAPDGTLVMIGVLASAVGRPVHRRVLSGADGDALGRELARELGNAVESSGGGPVGGEFPPADPVR